MNNYTKSLISYLFGEKVLPVLFLLIIFFPILSTAQPLRSIDPGPSYHFINGQWFNGQEFEKREFYTENGFLTTERPAKLDSVIDLNGKFVVPPYGEAHNHNISDIGPTSFDTMYVERGIFYVKNPNNMPRWRPPKGRVGMLNAVDATFAHGGITATGGHPTGLVQRNIGYEIFRKDDGDGGFLWYIDNLDDLDRKWPLIIGTNPDFIKTYLLYSEEHYIRKTDTTYFNRKGLDPEILNVIIDKAHKHGLSVSTHVETAVDFHHAVLAGSDEINHLPGFRFIEDAPLEDYLITAKSTRMAAEKGISVVTTLGNDHGDKKVRQLHIDNLKLLKKHGVKIAIGSDQYRGNSLDEARYLASLGVFSSLELLKIWCETTPKVIFPNRKIGKLENSYEANFLVLNENPLKDFENTQSIHMRIKQGHIITYDGSKQIKSLGSKLDELIMPLVITNNYSGTLAISLDGEIKFSKGYGRMNHEYSLQNTLNTKFFLASASMIFTSAAVMKLVDQDKLSLDDPLSKFLPDFNNGDKITIHDMLAQRSGIPAIGHDGNIDYDEITKFSHKPEELISYFENYDLLFEPGTQYNHGRSEYILLAHIIERTSGKTFGKYLKDEIFTPLGMHNSGHYSGEKEIITNLAKGYAPQDLYNLESAYQIDWSSKTGHASIYSTVMDLQKFGQAVIDNKLLSSSSWDKVLTDYGDLSGYGWFISPHGDRKRYQINGRSPGFSSYFAIYPDDGLIVAMLSNIYVSLPATMGKPIASLVFGEPYNKIKLRNVSFDKSYSSQLTGTYKFGENFYRPNFELQVTEQNGNLYCNWGGLIPMDEGMEEINKFILRTYWSDIEFLKNDNGSIYMMLFDNFKGEKIK